MDAADELTLEKLLDKEDISRIQSGLSDIVSFSVVTVNSDGTPISSLSNFSEFCRLIRSSKKGMKGCIECDRNALHTSIKQGCSIIYNCHCGIKDCAVPIVVEGRVVGGVLGGQVLVRESDRPLVDTAELSKRFGIEKRKLDDAVAELDVVTGEYLQKSLQFYGFLSEFIAEEGYKSLIQQRLAEETMERIRLQHIVTEQTLKRIQAQMNPHFLFNALNSIARTAMMEDAPETEQLIYDLSDYLRYTIKTQTDTVTIAQELDNLNHYLNIQKLRLGGRIAFDIHSDSSLNDCRIPSMTLQPLVENAIIHGLKDCASDGKVSVTIRKRRGSRNRELEIIIEDNGCGMPRDIIDSLDSGSIEDNPDHGLGLANTQLRIKTMYGSNYGITVESSINSFTKLTITLPIIFH